MKKAVKLLAVARSICAMGVSSCFGSSSFSELNHRVLKTRDDHPYVKGFTYAGGSYGKELAKSSYGYFYSDTDYYYTPFTDVSRLYLVRVRTNFTPGSVASSNGESGFDNHYDLWSVLSLWQVVRGEPVSGLWLKLERLSVQVPPFHFGSIYDLLKQCPLNWFCFVQFATDI